MLFFKIINNDFDTNLVRLTMPKSDRKITKFIIVKRDLPFVISITHF